MGLKADSGVMSLVRKSRLVAIVRLDDLSHALPLSEALFNGGITVQEFTLTNPHALEVISACRDQLTYFQSGNAVIGAGSVRCTDDARRAIGAGAQFIVTPILDLHVIEHCVSSNIPIMCGALTPTEIATAWSAGASAVKVFPVRGLGPDYVRDVLAPMPELALMPTGGVGLENLADYLAAGACAVGVGGKLIDSQAVAAQDWSTVSHVAEQYASLAANTAFSG
ncbi:MAG: bifunctional 4-hydroxy-2-oxoglutarate aldolase/2-dehydro-3-deoxy-phosphogluconate aldolase [Planctomycetales bacterium]|nr:bifunctional 4-hydroxy-2-oxoglutarate aldolase/2-dehydro-3-deoxy-phosphogluconate aldolase [Planctomycetales bacterium]